VDTSFLVNAVLSGVLGGGRKRSRLARRYLTGHGSLWSNPTTLLTAAGVAWGVFETLQKSTSQTSVADTPSAPPERTAPGPPPLPAPSLPDSGPLEVGVLRVVRLAISAASADGAINEQERAAIVQQAKSAGGGMADVAERELTQPRPLREIVEGVSSPEEAATLYVMAFTILRADEQLTATERIYLAQLAHLLRLDPSMAEALEKDTGERIEALGDQGQPGG
jgi:uncharacterized membrane protein YebE (DUF533 family)